VFGLVLELVLPVLLEIPELPLPVFDTPEVLLPLVATSDEEEPPPQAAKKAARATEITVNGRIDMRASLLA
jgi:hypothetical protein